MNNNGPIIVVEDDKDDRYLFASAFKELNFPNEIMFFIDGEAALKYLSDDSIYPFIILSDINMPKLNGFALRKMIHTSDALSARCVPFIFFSTAADKKAVFEAFTMSIQGFFLKPSNFESLKTTLRGILEYWQDCYTPNQFINT
jgi:CheY-like chemotaxis protein